MNRHERRASRRGAGTTSGSAPSLANVAFAEAVQHYRAGRIPEAEAACHRVLGAAQKHGEALHLLGVVALQQGRTEAAYDHLSKAVEALPRSADAVFHLGLAATALGRVEDAAARYRRAVQIEPRHQGAHNNLGRLLYEQGRLEAAAASYQRALALAPDPRVLCNLGRIRLDQRRPDEAASCYSAALALAPGMAQAHDGMGTTLLALGRPEAALPHRRRVAKLMPGEAGARVRLAQALLDAGHGAEALDLAIGLLSDSDPARQVFAVAVRQAPPERVPADLLARAIAEGWGRPRELARIAVAVLKQRPPVRDLLGGTPSPGALGRETLLCRLLEATPIPDLDFERALAAARHGLLRQAMRDAAPLTPDALAFWCALARQFFITDYLADCPAGDTEKAVALAARLSAALEAEADIPVLWTLAAACHASLLDIPHSERLLARRWPDAVQEVLRQQVQEPQEETVRAAALSRLTRMDAPLSAAVRRQYEENPYPRWVTPGPATPATDPGAFLANRFPRAALKPVPGGAEPEILIAGCGTGQQPIEMKRLFPGARVLAIDLSLASLGYAQRKTTELGIDRIAYAQADLLQLPALGRQFDVIAASGVLHHLADPLSGWRALLDCLRPGGSMLLGFYSEAARRDVVAARAAIAERGLAPTSDGVRAARRLIAEAEPSSALGRLARSSDFYSLSACRDLLFHVQETRLTLPVIAGFIAANGLTLLGFDLPAAVLATYAAAFPADVAMTDLECWHQFETAHPATFAAMYQFWVQR